MKIRHCIRFGLALLLSCIVFPANSLLADTLIYRSGRKVEGKMIHINGFRVLFRRSDGREIAVPSSQIRRVIFGDRQAPPKPAKPEKPKRPEPPRREPARAVRKEPRKQPAPPPRKPPEPPPKRVAPVPPKPVEARPAPAPELFQKSESGVVRGSDEILYAARPVKVTLAPAENSGAGTIYYSINDAAEAKYAAPFTLSQTGFYHIRYFAVDPAGNREVLRHKKVYVDRTAPLIQIDFQGRQWTDRLGVSHSGSPLVFLRAHDLHTGVRAFRCRLGAEVIELSREGGVIALPEAGKTHELTCQARDRVGNQVERTSYLRHDASGPRVAWIGDPARRSMKSGTRVAFSVQDDAAERVTLRLLVDDQVHTLPPGSRSFAPAEFESKSGVERTFVLIAVDPAGNETRTEPLRLRIDRTPPVSELKIAK